LVSGFLVDLVSGVYFLASLSSAEAFLLLAYSENFLAYYFLNSPKNLLYSSNDFLELAHLFFLSVLAIVFLLILSGVISL
jgi:hypothetical protein